MSTFIYIASDKSLPEMPNPHERHFSVNEALELGLEVPTPLLASGIDRDWKGAVYWSDREIHFDLDHGTVDDGGLADDFSIMNLNPALSDIYTELPYRAAVECIWNVGRAEEILSYMRKRLIDADVVEFWKIWLGCDQRPKINHYSAAIGDLTPEDLLEIADFSTFEKEPIHHCLTVTK